MSVRDHNIGESDYSKHKVQVWDIILEYDLNFFDGCIQKYLLRTKNNRRQDYEKIIHIAQERIRQIDEEKL